MVESSFYDEMRLQTDKIKSLIYLNYIIIITVYKFSNIHRENLS